MQQSSAQSKTVLTPLQERMKTELLQCFGDHTRLLVSNMSALIEYRNTELFFRLVDDTIKTKISFGSSSRMITPNEVKNLLDTLDLHS